MPFVQPELERFEKKKSMLAVFSMDFLVSVSCAFWCGYSFTPQMSLAYSPMARSEEK
jgi:hypothetical protein